VVVQEVYPDGLIAQDGRLQPGDQIIEINGADMTCSTHAQVSSFGSVIVATFAHTFSFRLWYIC
jgi:C-terminal processing protease CtpA/Prc